MDIQQGNDFPIHPTTLALIPEKPASRDTFGGTHERTARLIAQNIIANPHLKTVGLLGPWGSGKSTVVGLVGEHLRKPNKCSCQVFVFDAWKYQTDAPKRAFIEALVGFVAETQGETYVSWRDDLDRLTGRVEVTQTYEVPTIPKQAVRALYATLLVPVGTILLTRCDAIGRGWPWLGVGGTAFVGLVVAMAPLLYAVGSHLAPKNERRRLAWWQERKDKSLEQTAFEEQPAIRSLLKKEATHSTKRVIKDPVPSTQEFQYLVREIIKAAIPLARRDTERLLVVIDNLDRLPDDEATTLWATIRSLFHGPDGQNPTGGLDGVTVLAPLAEDTIERRYEKDGPLLAEAFLDKAFDLTVRLPRPSFTQWQSYFGTKLREVFGTAMDAHMIAELTTVVDAALTRDAQPTTPRRINTLVNRMGMLWLQWADKGASNASIAFYALNQRAFDANIWAAMMDNALMGTIDAHWKASVCAMHYGVSPTTGLDVLMQEALPGIIERNDEEAFRGMAAEAGFSIVLERVARTYLDSIDSSTVIKTVALSLKVPQATTAEFRQVFSLLARGYIQSVSTGTPGPEADIIRQLIELVAPGTRVALANKYLARLPLVDKKGFDSGGHAGAAELLEGIDLFVADDADAWPTDGWVVVPGAGENFLNLAMKLRERSALLPHLTSGEVIDSRIAMSASSADEFRFADQRFMALACSAVKVNWQPYIDSIEQTLVQPKTGVVATAFYALTVLCERNEGNVKNLAVRMMADSGNGHVLFRNAIELTDETTFARALVAFLRLRQGTIPALPYPVSTWCDRMPELPTALSHALKLMTPDRGAALTGLDVIEAADSRLDVRRIAEQTITARADT